MSHSLSWFQFASAFREHVCELKSGYCSEFKGWWPPLLALICPDPPPYWQLIAASLGFSSTGPHILSSDLGDGMFATYLHSSLVCTNGSTLLWPWLHKELYKSLVSISFKVRHMLCMKCVCMKHMFPIKICPLTRHEKVLAGISAWMLVSELKNNPFLRTPVGQTQHKTRLKETPIDHLETSSPPLFREGSSSYFTPLSNKSIGKLHLMEFRHVH